MTEELRQEAREATEQVRGEVDRLWGVIHRRDEDHQQAIQAEEQARAEIRKLKRQLELYGKLLERERSRGKALEQRIARLCDRGELLEQAQSSVAREAKRCLATATKAALAAARCEDLEEAQGHIAEAQGELDIARGVLVGLAGPRRPTLLRAWTLVQRYVDRHTPSQIRVAVRPEAA